MANPRGNPQNLRAFKKGKEWNGNPGGIPKEFKSLNIQKPERHAAALDDGVPKIREYATAYLKAHPEAVRKIVKMLATDKSGIKLLWQMLEGKPREQQEVSGGVHLMVNIAPDTPLSSPNDAENLGSQAVSETVGSV